MSFLNSPGIPRMLPQSREAPAVFSGRAGRFLGLLIKGALLQLVTFGFYRFWMVTELRRHLWNSTSVGGDALEYSGRGRELLIGFLFALAILAPVFLIYFFLGIEAERIRAFLSLPMYLFLYLFGQFAVYRARRYRLTRTIWRGVRFWMQGSGWNYALKVLGWGILVGLTLGLALPWREAALERYKMRNTYYGDLQGHFAGTGWGLFKRGWWIWLLFVLVISVPFAFAILVYAASPEGRLATGFQLDPRVLQSASASASLKWLTFLVPLFLLALYIKFKAIEYRWWFAGLRFGSLAMESGLQARSLLWLYIKLALFMLLVVIGYGVIGTAAAAAFLPVGPMPAWMDNLKGGPEALARLMNSPGAVYVIGAALLGYLVILLTLGIVQRFFMQRDFWRVLTQSLTIVHLEAADAVVAKGAAVSGFGEGLADGLDVAGF